MRRYRSGTRWCLWRWTEVRIRGAVYLRRLHLVQTPWFAIMVHWILGADAQPDLHDHPVSFLSLILRGWYIERRSSGQRLVRWFNWLRATDRHRILYAAPKTVTLALAGPVVRRWGFHTTTGWVPWREYQR